MTEVELAASVVAWLRSQRWEVYQEVGTGYACPVADIVAVNGSLHWIVACKTSLSLAVLSQALWWTTQAHYVSVATLVPTRKTRKRGWPCRAAHTLLHDHGIGLLTVARAGEHPVEEHRAPTLNRKARGVGRYLTDEQKDWAPAGGTGEGRWTPYAQTCRNLVGYVRTHCGCTLRDAMEHLSHHYRSDASARANLNQWLSRGKVKGIVCSESTRPRRLHVVPCVCKPKEA